MIAAFRTLETQEVINLDIDDDTNNDEEELEPEYENEIETLDLNSLMDQVIQNAVKNFETGLNNLSDSEMPIFANQFFRNPCMAHLIQCSVRDSIRASELVTRISKHINGIVTMLNKSPRLTAEFRKHSGGLNLIKPCATRWNSLFYCLQRILRGDGVTFKLLII